MKVRQAGLTNRRRWDKRMVVVRQRGVTLLEMIVVITILLILMGAAVPIMKVSVPPSAPGFDPVHGTSRNWICFSASFSPIRRLELSHRLT